MDKMVPVVPVSIDAIPCPVDVLRQTQRHYLEAESVIHDVLVPLLNGLAKEYAESGTVDPGIFRAVKEIASMKKLQLEYLKVIKELTHDEQTAFEKQAIDVVVALAKNDADLSKMITDEVVRKMMDRRNAAIVND